MSRLQAKWLWIGLVLLIFVGSGVCGDEDPSLVDWMELQQRLQRQDLFDRLGSDRPSLFDPSDPNSVLLVGVRTAVVSHFPFRQAIRQTWASKNALPPGVKVLFLGCRPQVPPDSLSLTELKRIWNAVALEKLVYGDLLTDELDCDDSYFRLADKTKQFFHFAAEYYPNARYVMIADDDLYLRLQNVTDKLLDERRERYYAGHVRALIPNAKKEGPDRNPWSINYLSERQYPLGEMMPFTLGASFLLSMDCVQFVSKNRDNLRDLGGMDDISIALWMLIKQIHPEHYAGMRYLRKSPCEDDVVSLSDVSVVGIRAIHANIQSGRRLCDGYTTGGAWLRQNIGTQVADHCQHLSFPLDPLRLEFSVSRPKEIVITAITSTGRHDGVEITYSPLREKFEEFLRRICGQIRLFFPNAEESRSCSNWTDRLRAGLHSLYGNSEKIGGVAEGTLARLNDALSFTQELETDDESDFLDPVTALMIEYPLDGAVVRQPVKFSVSIRIRSGGVELFREVYGGMAICFEVNNASRGCYGLDMGVLSIAGLDSGTNTARIYFSELSSDQIPISKRYGKSLPTSFIVIDDTEFDARASAFIQDKQTKYRAGYDLSLLKWASQPQHEHNKELRELLGQDKVETIAELVLLIGVKTAIHSNFAHRQAIRETWGSKAVLPPEAKVVFIGCRPFPSAATDNKTPGNNDAKLRQAIELEKMVYGDILTDELDCDDIYADLGNKVKEFLHVAATQYSHAHYVMIADDDIYFRADELVQEFKRLGPQKGYYLGQAPSIQHGRKDRPMRAGTLSLSRFQYPLSELPPLAQGAYFFLSMDCVQFISKNRRRLRDLGGMDDITVALWMLAIQVHVQHDKRLGFLRNYPCEDHFMAFGDLSALAIREVHSNIQEGRPFCHGFDQHLWAKWST